MLRYRVINALHLDNKKKGYERNPTGGVTSPLLWNLVINGLLLRLKHTGCNVTAYADDLVLLITGKFLPTISELMENALGLTLRWIEKNGLGIGAACSKQRSMLSGKRLIYTLEGPARNISIYIDSQAAIKALSTNTVKSKLARNTAAALNQCQHPSIRLVWVPGHAGVSGNEMADECARAGSALPASCAVADICKPIQDALSELTRTERATADRHLAAILGCLVSKALWPRYNPQRTAELLHFNKNRIRLLTGVLTGHCHIGRMAQRYGGPYQDF
ncbi:hypothetical protein ACLKA6_009039 [Drosophila palustris]